MNPNAPVFVPKGAAQQGTQPTAPPAAARSPAGANKENIPPPAYLPTAAPPLVGHGRHPSTTPARYQSRLVDPPVFAATSPSPGGSRPPLTTVYKEPPPLPAPVNAIQTPARRAASPARAEESRALFFGGSTPHERSAPRRAAGPPHSHSLTPGSASRADKGGEEKCQRRLEQRSKQIQYGHNTAGFANMRRLAEHDPRLCLGGVIPLPPPTVGLVCTKRTWDAQIRKWRRALHMFDDVFIDGDDNGGRSLEEVVGRQRGHWVSPVHHGPDGTVPPAGPVRMPREALLEVRRSANVPRRIPTEEALRHMLRSPDCFEDVTAVVPENTLYQAKGSRFTAADVGIKIVIAPSTVAGPYAAARSPSPEMPEFAPSPVAQRGPSDHSVSTGAAPSMSVGYSASRDRHSTSSPPRKPSLHRAASPANLRKAYDVTPARGQKPE